MMNIRGCLQMRKCASWSNVHAVRSSGIARGSYSPTIPCYDVDGGAKLSTIYNNALDTWVVLKTCESNDSGSDGLKICMWVLKIQIPRAHQNLTLPRFTDALGMSSMIILLSMESLRTYVNIRKRDLCHRHMWSFDPYSTNIWLFDISWPY